MWWAFLWCWAGLPPAVLDPSVLDERVGIDLIVTHLDLACAQTTPHLPKKNLGHVPITGGAAMGELWQANVIKITKEIRLLLKQNK